MLSPTDNSITEARVVEVPQTNNITLAFNQVAADNIWAPIFRVWVKVYRRSASVFSEEAVAALGTMPASTPGFIINCLLAFAQIKSQGKPGFPFETHPKSVMISVTSLLIYGLASVTQHIISTSVYAAIARFGRISSLSVLIASLAALFYF